jgi:hypothetical protein
MGGMGADTWRNDYVPTVPNEKRLTAHSASYGTVSKWDKMTPGQSNPARVHQAANELPHGTLIK